MSDPSPNAEGTLPRLADGRPFAAVRSHHLDGTIPTYWGPKQDGPAPDGTYTPPGDWPRAGTLLRVPRVARWFWEAPAIDLQVAVALGFTGTYQYGTHTNTFDLDIATPPGVFPGHAHERIPAGLGVPFYGVKFTDTLSGELDTVEGRYVATGAAVNWYVANYLPPIILADYEDPASDTHKAIGELWQILSGGFSPAVPSTQAGAPPITSTPDGPESVGVSDPVRTGIYYIDLQPFGEPKDLNTVGLTIPAGWHVPPPDPPNQTADLVAAMEQSYRGSTFPYFDTWDKNDGQLDDFLGLVTPGEDGFFGTHSLTILSFGRPHPLSAGDPRIGRIRAAYPHLASYHVAVLIDDEPFDKLRLAGDPEVDSFLGAIEAVAGSLADCGWTVAHVRGSRPDESAAIVAAAVAALLAA